MNKKLLLDELNNFINLGDVYRHSNSQMCYTEGVKNLVDKTVSYWLIQEIAFEILPHLLEKNKDWFYLIELSVKPNQPMVIIISDGHGNVHLKHLIDWTDFPVLEKTIMLFLRETEKDYCLMLPSES
ncbi:MAG: hypothetical protein K0R24_2334 [Gammaproteobacteria bacterium]|nr:hypothetical protein [Gammaproteobacteria bacterium]